jgi:polysaccharide export outer membrane protein
MPSKAKKKHTENNKRKNQRFMKKRSIIILMAALTLTGCQSYKRVPYLQSYQSLTDKSYQEIVINEVNQQDTLYDAHIQPKDLLSITINTTDPMAAAPFNLTVQTPINVTQGNSISSQPALQQYLVSNTGEIDFPVIGKLKIGGLTKSEAENLIREKLKPYLKETPIVTVRMSNYKISVIGEVNSPGTFTINNEKVNIFEALAMAGDMTVYGIRSNVKLIREDNNGQRHIVTLNLNEANILHSPYYHLQQNDILYITPNKTKAKNASISNSTTIWFSVIGTLVSLASLLITIAK